MNLWALSDLHLPGGTGRTMDQFGPLWHDHVPKLLENWRKTVLPQDMILLGGDLTWARKTSDALADLQSFSRMPGLYKIMVKGNHDTWWKSKTRLTKDCPKDLVFLQGNAVKLQGQVFAGVRGWLAPNDPCSDALDQKTFEKELAHLSEALLKATQLNPTQGIHLLMHFPPFTTQGQSTAFWDKIQQFPVKTCTYGHFHMTPEWEAIPKGVVEGIQLNLTSADYLDHKPTLITSW